MRKLTIALESRSKFRRGLASFGPSHHLTQRKNEFTRWRTCPGRDLGEPFIASQK